MSNINWQRNDSYLKFFCAFWHFEQWENQMENSSQGWKLSCDSTRYCTWLSDFKNVSKKFKLKQEGLTQAKASGLWVVLISIPAFSTKKVKWICPFKLHLSPYMRTHVYCLCN